jgi:DNA topoisomerase IA
VAPVVPTQRFLLKALATVLVFPGWLAVYGEEAAEARDGDAAPNEHLPALQPGQPLRLHEVLPAQHYSQPPRRYSEASLVKALEEAGIGRPSTYATIVSTILDRGYVALEQRTFVPTELGFAANDFLVAHFPRIVDLPFTAQMEDELDEIAAGRRQWTQMLRAFYGPFATTVAEAQSAPISPLKREEPRLPAARRAAHRGRPPAPGTKKVVRARRAKPAAATKPPLKRPGRWNPRPEPADDPLLDQLPF